MLTTLLLLTGLVSARAGVPVFENDQAFISAGENEFLKVECSARGDPEPHYKWFNEAGVELGPNSFPPVHIESGWNGNITFSNLVFNLTLNHTGFYTCTAENVHGKRSKLYNITINDDSGTPPVFEDDPASITVGEKEFLVVRCSARADPEPSYVWLNEAGVELGPDSYPFVLTGKEWYTNLTFSDLIFNLTVANHTGFYFCRAENKHGRRSKLYNITINANTGDDQLVLVNVTTTTATFRLDLSGSQKTLDTKYKEKVENKMLYATRKGGEDIVYKNLIPSGFYQFYFALRDSSKTWNATVVLLPSVPEVIFRHLSDGQLTLEWFRTFDDNMRGTIDKYRLEYLTVQMYRGNYWERSKCNGTIEIPSCLPSRYTLANLEKRVYYEIVVSAHTSAGYGMPFRNKVYLP